MIENQIRTERKKSYAINDVIRDSIDFVPVMSEFEFVPAYPNKNV